MTMPRPRGVDPAGGFTLVEILVAFAVAALLLGALYQVFSVGVRSGTSAESYSKAVLIAQSSLDAVAVGSIAAGDVSDRVGPYRRRVRIRLRSDLVPAGAAIPVAPYEVEVRVEWLDGVRQREISLTTIRLGDL